MHRHASARPPIWVLMVIAAMAVGLGMACGGGDNDSGSDGGSDTQPTATQEASSDTPSNGDSSSRGESVSGDTGGGTMTIGDQTWEIVADIQCLHIGNNLGLNGHAVNDPSIQVSISAQGDAQDDSDASLKNEAENVFWRAGSIYQGATVPEFEIDGNHVQGTATFVNIYAPANAPETAEGSFEFSCP